MIDNEEQSYRDVLPQGFVLHWYEVKSVLGRGAFGVTYLARDKNLDQMVAIKEYFPNEFSTRETGYTVHPMTTKSKEMYEWGLNRFIREARTLAKFKHPNIVRVLSVFENNNTAYMVMEYEQGIELSKLYKQKSVFSQQELLDIFLPIMEGLKFVHDAGFIHRDIKPSNIYIRKDSSPVLIDFGSARQVSGAPTRALTSLVTYGYAPFEQYNESEDKQGPWTDVYALGASLYYGLTKKLPVEALTRGSSLLSTGIDPYKPLSVTLEGQYSASFLRTIDHALLFHANERPQDILEWTNMLTGKVDVSVLPVSQSHQALPQGNTDATVIRDRHTGAPSGVSSGIASNRAKDARVASSTTSRLIPVLLISILLVGAGATYFYQQEKQKTEASNQATALIAATTSIEPKPSSEINVLLAQADRARLAGNDITPKNNNALQLYTKLLSLDPLHKKASAGIVDIINRYREGIRSNLADGNVEKAEADLQRLLSVKPDSTILRKLEEDINAAKFSHSQQRQLLAQADKYIQQQKYLSPIGKNAISTLRRVLEIDPGNQAAKQRIETVATHYVSLAKKEINAGKLSAAHKSIRNIRLVNDAHSELAVLNRQLETAKAKNKKQKISRFIGSAKKANREGFLIAPTKKNAFYFFQKALKLDSKNQQAIKGIKGIERRISEKMDTYLEYNNTDNAEILVANIEKNMPRSAFSKNIIARWNDNKPLNISDNAPVSRPFSEPENVSVNIPTNQPDTQMIELMIGNFKQAFESRNQRVLMLMSENASTRREFIDQIFNNYRSITLKILNVKIISQQNSAQMDVKITKLVNLQGMPVQPGSWSQFVISIKKNEAGQWKVYW